MDEWVRKEVDWPACLIGILTTRLAKGYIIHQPASLMYSKIS